jgi:hypothetical protein
VEKRGRLSPPPPCPCPLHHLVRTLTQKVFSPPPPCLCGSPGNAFDPFFLLSRMLLFVFGAVGLPPRHIHGQGDPLWVTVYAFKTLQHEHSMHRKRQKSTQSSGNKPGRTHPGAGNPISQGNQARARASVYPERNDPPDLGVSLRIH